MVVRLGTFIPFEASYYLNGHSYIEQELGRQGVGWHQARHIPAQPAPKSPRQTSDRPRQRLVRPRMPLAARQLP